MIKNFYSKQVQESFFYIVLKITTGWLTIRKLPIMDMVS